MARYLRKATAATLKMGPFASPFDGITPYTTAIPAASIKVSANGGALAAAHAATATAHDADGFHAVALDATDTGPVGRIKVEVPGSAGNYLPVWDDFVVLDPAVYDALFGASAPALASQVPASFTAATFASAGVFAAAALAAAPTAGALPGGTVVAGSTAGAVVLSGLAAGKTFAGQRLLDPAAGEYRAIAAQSYAGGNYTLTLGTGSGESGPFSATPTTGVTLYLCP